MQHIRFIAGYAEVIWNVVRMIIRLQAPQSTELKPPACTTEKDEAWSVRDIWDGRGREYGESSSARA